MAGAAGGGAGRGGGLSEGGRRQPKRAEARRGEERGERGVARVSRLYSVRWPALLPSLAVDVDVDVDASDDSDAVGLDGARSAQKFPDVPRICSSVRRSRCPARACYVARWQLRNRGAVLSESDAMYPWYRDSVSQLGQFCASGNPIKTENGYSDCMLALDYAAQTKVNNPAPPRAHR